MSKVLILCIIMPYFGNFVVQLIHGNREAIQGNIRKNVT